MYHKIKKYQLDNMEMLNLTRKLKLDISYNKNTDQFIDMISKALILGGYGNFGRMISKALAKQNVPVVIAGRNQIKLKQFENQLKKSHIQNVQFVQMDAYKHLKEYLLKNKPGVVVNTCGPFQTLNFKIVEDCIDSKVNYIDLADGREFVRQILKFNKLAQECETTVITGASTAPGLSSAILQKFLPEFKSVESVVYGFSPGQKSTRGGQATAEGVMSYVGKKIKPYGNLSKYIYGWQDLYAQNYPGVGHRLMGNVDHPDYQIFPNKYNLNNFRFSAGVQSKMLHIGIWITSWLIRAGFPIDLPKHSGNLLNLSHHLFDWMGTDVGVMHMKILGTNLKGNKFEKTWFLIARKGHGPNVAAVPSIFLAEKICKEGFKRPGVHPCAGLISLEEYMDCLKNFDIQTFTEEKYF